MMRDISNTPNQSDIAGFINQINTALVSLDSKTSGKTGNAYFEALLIGINEILCANLTLLGELSENQDSCTTLFICENNNIIENLSYSLLDTPCQGLVDEKICIYEDGVQKLFPKDALLQQMDIVAYAGTPIVQSGNGKTKKLILVSLFKKPLQNHFLIDQLLRFLSPKIKLELEREDATKKIQESEMRFRQLSNLSKEGLIIHRNGIILDTNKAAEDILGYSNKELVGMNGISTFVHPDDLSTVLTHVKTKNETPYNVRLVNKHNVVLYVELEARDTFFKNEQVRAVTLRNITEKHLLIQSLHEKTQELEQLNSELKKSESKYRDLFTDAGVSIWNEDLSLTITYLKKLAKNGVENLEKYLSENESETWRLASSIRLVQVNDATLEMFEAENEEALFQNYTNTFTTDSLKVFNQALCAIWNNKRLFKSEVKYKTLKGKEFTAIVSIRIPTDEAGFKSIPLTIINIDDRKKAERALKSSEARYRELFESANDAIIIVDQQSRKIIQSNAQANELFEYDSEELTRLSFLELRWKRAEAKFSNIKKYFEFKNTGSLRFEDEFVTKSGKKLHVEISAKQIELDGKVVAQNIIRDITERIENENELNTYINRLKDAEKIGKMGAWDMDLVENTMWISDEHYHLLGEQPASFIPTIDTLSAFVIEKDKKYVSNAITEAVKKKELFLETYRIVDSKGNEKVILSHGRVETNIKGKALRFHGVSVDMTDVYKDQLRLEQTKHLENAMLDAMADGLAIYNKDFSPIIFNRRAYEMLQLSADEFSGKSLYNTYWKAFNAFEQPLSADDFPVVVSLREKREINDFVMGVQVRDGNKTWVSVNTKLISMSNQDGYLEDHVLVSFADISDLIEKRKVTEIFNVAFNSMEEGIVIHDNSSKIIQFNDASCKILGLTSTQLEGRDSFDPQWKTIKPNGDPFPSDEHPAIITLKTGKRIRNKIMGIHKPNGELSWISINSSPIYFNKERKGLPDCAIATFTDISNQVISQRELTLLNTAISQLSNHVMITDRQGNIEYVNPAFELATGFKLNEVRGKRANILKSGVQGPDFYKNMWATLNTGKTFRSEITNRSKDGKPMLEDLFITPIFNELNEISNFIGIYTDLEEKEKTRLAVRKLEEKDILLKEIHHRVKNNLQIVSSLLSLQSSQLKEDIYQDIFKTSQQRVASIALVHEKLYQSSNLKVVNARDYVLDLIRISSVASSLGMKINEHIEVHDFDLSLDAAVPCGLIINEAISNIYKHAFNKTDENPSIDFQFTSDGECATLLIADNGKGIEDINKAMKSNSLGLKLIKNLSRQLKADFNIHSKLGEGVLITLKFKL